MGGRGVGWAGPGGQRLGRRAAINLYSSLLVAWSTPSGRAPLVVHLGDMLVPLGRNIFLLCKTREGVLWVRVWGL